MNEQNPTMPKVGRYRGIELHDFQSRDRIEKVVCPEIDLVLATDDPKRLAVIAADVSKSPEARLAAGRRIIAMATDASGKHRSVPGVDVALVQAHVAGLDHLTWADTNRYGTILCSDPPLAHGGQRASPRPRDYGEALRRAKDERSAAEHAAYQARRRAAEAK